MRLSSVGLGRKAIPSIRINEKDGELNHPNTCTSTTSNVKNISLTTAGLVVVGAAAAPALVVLGVGVIGFGASGVAAGSTAAAMMSAEAAASGGIIAAGGTVATLQSIGTAGSLGVVGTNLAMGIGAMAGSFVSRAASAVVGIASGHKKQDDDIPVAVAQQIPLSNKVIVRTITVFHDEEANGHGHAMSFHRSRDGSSLPPMDAPMDIFSFSSIESSLSSIDVSPQPPNDLSSLSSTDAFSFTSIGTFSLPSIDISPFSSIDPSLSSVDVDFPRHLGAPQPANEDNETRVETQQPTPNRLEVHHRRNGSTPCTSSYACDHSKDWAKLFIPIAPKPEASHAENSGMDGNTKTYPSGVSKKRGSYKNTPLTKISKQLLRKAKGDVLRKYKGIYDRLRNADSKQTKEKEGYKKSSDGKKVRPPKANTTNPKKRGPYKKPLGKGSNCSHLSVPTSELKLLVEELMKEDPQLAMEIEQEIAQEGPR